MSAPLLPQLRLFLPSYPAFKLFSYAAGSSSSKQNTYSDATLATPNANPLSAAASGLLGPVFLDPALAYHFIVALSTEVDPPTGTAIIDQDNVTTVPGQALSVLSKTANYTVLVADGEDVLVLADATAGAFTVTLYTATGNAGKKVRVVKIDGSANAVTVDPNGAQTINGAATQILTNQYAATNIVSDGSNWVKFAEVIPVQPIDEPQGRLTLETGVPVSTTDQSAKASLFYTPYKGNRIALYDGVGNWTRFSFTELTLSLAALTASKLYDIFAYNNAGTVALEALVWTNTTTRATALVLQNGVWVKTGATTRRYLGTIYINTSGGQTDDSLLKRNVYNYYNRVLRPMRVLSATGSWTYSTATLRQANADAANQLEFVIGVDEEAVEARVHATAQNNNAGVIVLVSIGLDSTSGTATGTVKPEVSTPVGGYQVPLTAAWIGHPGVGRHLLVWLEMSAATPTTTWTGVNGGLAEQSGIVGSVRN